MTSPGRDWARAVAVERTIATNAIAVLGRRLGSATSHPCHGSPVMRLPLKDRQVVVRHLQDEASHRGAVLGANGVAPTSVFLLVSEERVANGGVPLLPVRPAGVPHGLHGVVM